MSVVMIPAAHLNRFSGGALTAMLLASSAMGGSTLYVDDDAPPGGDGAGWDSALRYLQDALTAVADSGGSIAEVRVASGIYLPDRNDRSGDGTGDRGASFHVALEVALVGGYAGLGAFDPNERDPDRYPSILSGDLAQDDGVNFTGNEENSFHVLTATGGAPTLDGFTITAGNADGGGASSRGAGIYLIESSPTLVNCTIVANMAGSFSGSGAGVYCSGGFTSLIGCRFIGTGANQAGHRD